MLLSGGCTILAFVVLRRWGWERPRGKFGLVYLGLFLGMLFVFFGDVTGGIYDIILRVATPFPSFADVAYLIGYIVVSLALLQFLWFFRDAVGRWASKMVLLFCVSVGGLGLLLVLSHGVAHAPVMALDATYPILDGILVMLSLMILLCFRSKFISPPWIWLALGALLIGVGHFLNGLGSAEGWYHFPDPIDLFFLWGYVSFGVGFSMQIKLDKQ